MHKGRGGVKDLIPADQPDFVIVKSTKAHGLFSPIDRSVVPNE